MNSVKVSILVPICNVEKYLDKCLTSILNQTLNDIEIICINDGSKDASLDIIKKFANKDSRVVIVDKVNTGYGDSMNRGLRLAKGEYVGIVESDDFIADNMFEELYSLAKAENADIVKSNYSLYWDNPERIVFKNNLKISEVSNKLEYCKERLFEGNASIWSAIYRRKFLEDNGLLFLPTPGASYQDTSFKFKTTILAQRVVLTPEAFLFYRQDNANSSVKASSFEKVMLLHKEYDEMYDFIEKNKNSECKRYLYTEILYGLIWNYKRVEQGSKGRYFKEMSSYLSRFHDLVFVDSRLRKYLRYGGISAIKNGHKLIFDILLYISNLKGKTS